MRPLAVAIVYILLASSLVSFIGGQVGEVKAASFPTWDEVLHLHDGPDYTNTNYYDWMNTTGPYNPTNTNYESQTPPVDGVSIRKNPSPNHRHFWVMYPPLDSGITISGNMTVHLWARSKGNQSGTTILATLSDMGPGQSGFPSLWTTIGQGTAPLVGPIYSEFDSYDISIPSGTYSLAAGHSLVLTVQRGDSLNDQLIVMFDTTSKDAYVAFTSNRSVSVDSAWTENSAHVQMSVFTDLDNIFVGANVSDPFGAYDIIGANVSVTNAGNGAVVLWPSPMTINRSDAGLPPYWKMFQISLPNLPSGSFVVNVTASDNQGIPSWFTCAITVVTCDHFGVLVPARAVAGDPFSITISALDASNSTVTNWVGTVVLEAFRPDKTIIANGTLSVTALAMNASDSGTVTNSSVNYSSGEETVLIRASAGPHIGWSAPMHFSSGPVVAIQLNRTSPWTVGAGTLLGLQATGRDRLMNVNSTWTPNWTVSGGIGSIAGSGTTVSFNARIIGGGKIQCSNDMNGANSSVDVTVVAGMLARIDVSAPSFDPLQIPEAESRVFLASGYDSVGNPVNLTNLTWDTTTSGTIHAIGTGPTAQFTAGYLPESGSVHARKGGVVGSMAVTISTRPDGPSFSNIPPQWVNENIGTWTLSLSGYWHDIDGTTDLTWWADNIDTSLFFVTHDQYSNAVIQFHTQQNRFGNCTFDLWAADSTGYMARTTVTVHVIHVNQPPRFVNSPPTVLYVKFDLPYTFDYSYYVADVDNAKEDLVLRSSSSNIYFDGLNATFMFPHKNDDVSYFEFVTLNLTDGQATAELKIVVWVTTDTPPEVVKTIAPISILEGTMNYEAFNISEYFADPDEDTLYYSYGFVNVHVDIGPKTHIVYLSAPGEWSGTEQGVFTATDPTGALKSQTVSVTVIPVNDPPRLIQSIGTVTVKYNLTYYLYLSPFLFDPDNSLDSLTFNISDPHIKEGMGPGGAVRLELLFPPSTDPNSSVFTGSYLVHVTMVATDPGGMSTVPAIEFDVRVTGDAPPQVVVQNPDQLYYSFPENSYLNGTLQLYTIFSDPDDSTLTFYLSAGKNVFARVFPSGDVNLSSTVNWSGMEPITIRALDSHGGWALVQVFIVVTPVNQAPVIYPIPNFINRGSSYRNTHYPISQYVYDSDDAYYNLTITATPAGNAFVIGTDLYIALPANVDVVTVTLQASDGRLNSNVVSFKVGVKPTMAEQIGWPFSFPLVLLGAAVAAYFAASRLPRPYSLENIFLIHNDGRLVAHVTREQNTTLDEDVVSAMFTAVQEFVRDSFQKGEVGLKKLEIGDKNVVIEKGRSAYVALIYSGWPTKETFAMLPMLLRDIEERYKERLEKWNGTMKTVKGVDRMLQDYMSNKFQPGTWHEEEELAEKEWVDMLEEQA